MNVLPPVGSTLRHAIFAINQLIQGRSNAVREVTLAAGVTTTTIVGDSINADAKPFLMPKTANAAAAMATTYASVTAAGVVTITHAPSALTDRTFHVLVIGG